MKIERRDFLWISLLFLTLAIFWVPTINIQPYLSTDDMGKDLYPFELSLKGEWPCRDYWWQYGPLMPFYYAFWFLVGGVNLISLRLGLAVIYLLCSLLTYRTLRIFASPPVAFLASLAFLLQEFYWPYYNFNHIGAVPFLIISIFCLWKYFLGRGSRWWYFGALALAGMTLIKINLGITSFLAFLASIFIAGGLERRGHLVLISLMFGILVLGGYATMYAGIPLSQVDHCMTARSAHREFPSYTLWTHFKHLAQWFLVWDRARLWWAALFALFGILGFVGLGRKGPAATEMKTIQKVVGSLFLFGLFNSSDFFMLGHIYRLDFWSLPILVLFMGVSAEGAKNLFEDKMRIFLGGLIFLGVVWLPFQYLGTALRARVPERYLDFPRGRVYVAKEIASTVAAIKEGTRFIIENTKPREEILVFPRDPLYCFLSGRRHALSELDFEYIAQYSEGQEEEFIRQIEAKQVALVVLANRDGSNPLSEKGVAGVGTFGKTHCQKLGKYIFENYQEAKTFGVWASAKPRISHAIKVFLKAPHKTLPQEKFS